MDRNIRLLVWWRRWKMPGPAVMFVLEVAYHAVTKPIEYVFEKLSD